MLKSDHCQFRPGSPATTIGLKILGIDTVIKKAARHPANGTPKIQRFIGNSGSAGASRTVGCDSNIAIQ
jgi:hypothetical protein